MPRALYGPAFIAGLNYWQCGEANFWGHNAIIRLAPFIEYCALPALPGKEPFGGHILSHDFVEAALMRKAGYAVRLLPTDDGSYEEGPPTLHRHPEARPPLVPGEHAALLARSSPRAGIPSAA